MKPAHLPVLTRNWLLRCLWLLLLPLASCEDTAVMPIFYGNVQGILRDARTNQPLANVSISTTPATMALTTDAQGMFELNDVPTGRLTITATKADYQQTSTAVTIEDGKTTTVAIQLTPAVAATAPNPPNRPVPADQAVDVAVLPKLEWHPVGAFRSDSLRYDLMLYEGNSTTNRRQLLTRSRDTVYQFTAQDVPLLYNTVYYWQVTVYNKAGTSARSSLWSFRTAPFPNNFFVFVRRTNGFPDIYSSNASGSTTVRLTNSNAFEVAPRFSPGYDKIAYTSNGASGQHRLYTMNRDGSDQRMISSLPVEGYNNFGIGFCWSPYGDQLLVASYDKLYRVNRDGFGAPTLIATAPAGRHFRECDWNGQSRKIIVQTVGIDINDSELYIMNEDGSGMTLAVGNVAGRLDSPSFNLAGTRIMYTVDAAGFMDQTGRQIDARIRTQALDGSAVVDVSASPVTTGGKPAGYNDLNPRFSANGAKIVFTQAVNTNALPPEVWQMDVDGRNRTLLFQNAEQPDAI
ncbi:carboxypeptidase regulatory-like domain-containing protein [Microvirga sp. STR05]|uniref:Carboxypeptidase regulatory-like domain-containing protein n=1 Tax=Hymenobacter duratus TaxID=2771356 RepID=A0ABR8JLU8_9BACT|nr:carboxypeptidase regulatory-like domain-containing protein [Hymenobacter duratus]MBD2716342.1 carboxypeptidase regulatory-like domain-containing protein [Hymenobacter duratus]MBR7951257.1 carboxypeptidase regulatory-like domain-containing protein [Microvirga sp. STR05]